MTGIVALPMYARPELTGPFARLCTLVGAQLHKAGISAPDSLSARSDVMALWLDPDLVLSQTCGMPYRLFLHGKVQLVATPDFGLEGCPPGHYRSAFVARASDPRHAPDAFADAVFAYNEITSQSGYAAPLNHARAAGFTFANRVQSHAHLASARMVAEGKADIAALDAVSWAHIQWFDGFARDLKVVGWTSPPTPALPFITARGNDVEVVRTALQTAIETLAPEDREAIGIRKILQIPADDYLAVEKPDAGPGRGPPVSAA